MKNDKEINETNKNWKRSKKVDMKHVFERNVNHCFKNDSHVLRILNMYKNVLDVYEKFTMCMKK